MKKPILLHAHLRLLTSKVLEKRFWFMELSNLQCIVLVGAANLQFPFFVLGPITLGRISQIEFQSESQKRISALFQRH